MATNTTDTFQNHNGTGSINNFAISFPFVSNAEVEVTVGGSSKTLGTHYNIVGSEVQFTSGNTPPDGTANVVFTRNTSISAKAVDFTDGSVLTESDLDTSINQILFAQQEIVQDYLKRDCSLTVTGDLVFEGSTDDTNETTLAITNPTADRTITIPDVTGTIVTTGDTGTVTSTMISDGTIVDGDISGSTSINGAKVNPSFGSQNISTTGKVTVDNIEIDGNTITTTAGNLGINSAGTQVQIDDDLTVKTDLVFKKDGDHFYIDNAHDANSPQSNLYIRNNVGSGIDHSGDIHIQAKAGEEGIVVFDDGVVALYTDGNLKFATSLQDTVGNLSATHLSPTSNNSFDLGTSGQRWREIYVDGIDGDAVVTSGTSTSDSKVYSAKRSDELFQTEAEVDARIITLVDEVGGFVPIASEATFPNSNPDVNNGAGTIVSVGVLSTSYTPSSGTVTIPDSTLTNISGSNVTITDCGTTVLGVGMGLLVETTSTLHTYKFHRLVAVGSEVSTVAGIASSIPTVATNIADVNNFADLYQIDDFSPSAPSTDGGGNSLSAGDLAYDSTANLLKVYTGSAWEAAASLNGSGGVISGDITFNDDVKLKFGSEFELFNGTTGNYQNQHVLRTVNTEPLLFEVANGSTGIFFNHRVGTGLLTFENMMHLVPNGAVTLHYDNSSKLVTNATGVEVTGIVTDDGANHDGDVNFYGVSSYNAQWDKSDASLKLLDNAKIKIGSSGDLQLFHDATANRIQSTTAFPTYIEIPTGQKLEINHAQLEVMARFNPNTSVELMYDGNPKLATTASGVSVTGELSASSHVKLLDNAQLQLGNSGTNDFVLVHDGTDNIINCGNNGVLFFRSATHKFQAIDATDRLVIDSSGNVNISNDATINSINVGKGANSVAENTVLGENALDAAVTGSANTAVGFEALTSNTSGIRNTAVGRKSLGSVTTGQQNTAVGQSSLFSNTASNNTAVGHDALNANTTGTRNTAVGSLTLDANTTGNDNTAIGQYALSENTTGSGNIAVGTNTLDANTTASYNTAVGYSAATANTTGTYLVAVGSGALNANTTGGYNTAIGRDALAYNTTASNNTALGANALIANTTGENNTAIGQAALHDNTTADENTAVGKSALRFNTTGSNNTAVGKDALEANTTGLSNVAIGDSALAANTTANNNTAIGRSALISNTTGAENTAIGRKALNANTTASNNTAVGYFALQSNTTGAGVTAFGKGALLANTTANYNDAFGINALTANTTGTRNVAVGSLALDANTTGNDVTAIGYSALSANTANSNVGVGSSALGVNTSGTNNVSVGTGSLSSNTTADNNTALGSSALNQNTTGHQNVAVGTSALVANTTGSACVAVGRNALNANTTSSYNTAIGQNCLQANTTGVYNTALGANALDANTTRHNNVAIGYRALTSQSVADQNTAVGADCMYSNTTGEYNTAMGFMALYGNTTANNNTAIGFQSLLSNTTGANNVAVGRAALDANTTANNNTAIGVSALGATTTSGNNTAVGNSALTANTTGASNTAVGREALTATTTGTNNVALGVTAGDAITTGDQNTLIGASADVDSATRTGACALGFNVATHSADTSFRVVGVGGVYNTGNTSSWNTTSDRRIKKNIVDSKIGLAEINQIKVRNFEYRTPDEITDSALQGYDLEQLAVAKSGIQVGCIAQELETIIPSAVSEDKQGIKNVQSDELTWHLIKAIQELSAKVTALEKG